jgi:hypothetical protein
MSCKLNIILDLDSTIINSIYPEDIHLVPADTSLKYQQINDSNMTTFERPFLQEFLDYLFANFNVGVLTHGVKSYGLEIVWRFIQSKPNRKVDFVLARDKVEFAMKLYPGTLKDLRFIWDDISQYDYYPCNTFIIDDNLMVKQSNPYNTISVHPFEVLKQIGNTITYDTYSEYDNTLLEVKTELEKLNNSYTSKDCSFHNQRTRCINLRQQPLPIPEKVGNKKTGRFFIYDV